MLVKYAFSINAFERIVKEMFPQSDIIQVGNFTSDRGIVEYKRHLEHDDLTDIIMTWPLTETASALRPMPNGWPTTKGARAASGSISAPPSIRFKP